MIPCVLAITPGDGRDLRGWLADLIAHGLEGVLIREPSLAGEDLDEIVAYAMERVPFVSVHTRHPRALEVAARWGTRVHVRAGDARSPIPFGVSTHDAAELDAAFAAGAEYALLSPVWRPTSKVDDRPPLGIDRFFTIARDRPVFALGGATPQRLREVRERDGIGVAALGALAGDAPGRTLAAFLRQNAQRSS